MWLRPKKWIRRTVLILCAALTVFSFLLISFFHDVLLSFSLFGLSEKDVWAAIDMGNSLSQMMGSRLSSGDMALLQLARFRYFLLAVGILGMGWALVCHAIARRDAGKKPALILYGLLSFILGICLYTQSLFWSVIGFLLMVAGIVMALWGLVNAIRGLISPDRAASRPVPRPAPAPAAPEGKASPGAAPGKPIAAGTGPSAAGKAPVSGPAQPRPVDESIAALVSKAKTAGPRMAGKAAESVSTLSDTMKHAVEDKPRPAVPEQTPAKPPEAVPERPRPVIHYSSTLNTTARPEAAPPPKPILPASSPDGASRKKGLSRPEL